MSSLNSEATKALLLEEDLLSSSGTIKRIWDLYIKNVNFQNRDNDILKVILKSLETNAINHLELSDDELESCVTSFTKMIDEVCGDMSQNELIVFLMVLAHALSEYTSIKSDTLDNIKINMEDVSKISQVDEFKIMSAMERYGLLDSAELQSLIDDRNLAITTACTNIRHRWGKSSPSDNEGSDAKKNPLLSLKDFLPKLDEIFLKAREMFVWRSMVVDNFPDTVSAMRALIMPKEDFDGEWFYHQGTYFTNLTNLKILIATAQFICSILDLDTTTALYILSFVNNENAQIIDQIGQLQGILFSQLMVDAMTIRFLIKDKGEESPDTTIAVNKIKDRLCRLVHILEDRSESFVPDEVTLFRKSHVIEEYVSSITSAAVASEEASATDSDFSEQEMNAAMDGLLSGVDNVRKAVMETMSCEGTAINVIGEASSDALSSLVQPSVEQASEENVLSDDEAKAMAECGCELHKELNQALMDGNFENAANAIAKEIAFEQEMLKLKMVWRPAGVFTEVIQPIMESVQLDVSTYSALLNRVPGGIAKYTQSASEYVTELLRTNAPTET